MPCSPPCSMVATLTKITVMFGNTRLEGSSLSTCMSPQGFSLTAVNASLISGRSYIFRSRMMKKFVTDVSNFKTRIILGNSTLILLMPEISNNLKLIENMRWKLENNIWNQLCANLMLAKVSYYILKMHELSTDVCNHTQTEGKYFLRKLSMLDLLKLQKVTTSKVRLKRHLKIQMWMWK